MHNEEVKELRKELGLAEQKIVSLEEKIAARDKDMIQLHEDLEREQAARKDERGLLSKP